MQTGYHISNTKSIWNSPEYTEVIWITGEEICPGDHFRLVDSSSLSIKE